MPRCLRGILLSVVVVPSSPCSGSCRPNNPPLNWRLDLSQFAFLIQFPEFRFNSPFMIQSRGGPLFSSKTLGNPPKFTRKCQYLLSIILHRGDV